MSKELNPVCGFCGSICHNIWYVERERKNQSNEEKLKKFTLCTKCYDLEKFPTVYLRTDFKKMHLKDIFGKMKKKYVSWPLEELKTLI